MIRVCTAHRSDGQPCRRPANRGAAVCYSHGGKSPQVARRAAVRAELGDWGLTDEKVDPAETLLRLLAQSSRRATLYADLIERQYVDEGVAALIGMKVSVGDDGRTAELGDYIRGLADLEAQERDRCARFAKLALDAGIAERQVRLAERQGALVADAVTRILDALGLTEAQRELVATVVPRELRAIAG